VVVVDFGIARATAFEDLTYTGEIKGKLGYLAPEQARGEGVDLRVDIHAVGLLIAHMLTGEPPQRGHEIAVSLRTSQPSRYVSWHRSHGTRCWLQ